MIALAKRLDIAERWRLLEWAAQAWRRFGLRHVALAFLVYALQGALGPLGGTFFLPFDAPSPPFEKYLNGQWLFSGVAIVYGVMVADEAFNDGVYPLRVFGLAVVLLAAIVSIGDWFLAGLFGWGRFGPLQMGWWALTFLFQGGLGISIYAYWRVTQRATQEAQAAETERVRNEQRVQAARLLALQSRVEPQMLFDALGRIHDMHGNDAQAADGLLADLIALLRAMLPGSKAEHSTIGREFALIDAWLRVSRVGPDASRIELRKGADVEAIGAPPMVLLPLLRSLLEVPGAAGHAWIYGAELTGGRVLVTLRPRDASDTAAASVLSAAELSPLRDRLAQLFGRFASLGMTGRPPTLTLDLPRMEEYDDDDRPDR